MKVLTCPINGPRPISEFACAGELREMPDPDTASDLEWADYVFNRNGVSGVKREWWCHTPSGVWFIAERDTARDIVVRTYLFGEGGEAQGGHSPGGQTPGGQALRGAAPGGESHGGEAT